MKILFIACYSPLINNSASIETLQYLNNLVELEGNEVHLLTVDFPKDSIYYDEHIRGMLDKRVKTHIISCGTVLERAMPKRGGNSDGEQGGNLKIKKMMRNIKKTIAIPDIYFYWAIKAASYGKELMKKEKFDVIFSMHEPPSSHICAMKIKKEFPEVPWITYWSDPWVNDPSRDNISDTRRKYEMKLEAEVVKYSDKFIFVTKENRTDFISKYEINPKNTYLITRGYDKSQYDEILELGLPELIDKDKINIIYAGEIFTKLRDVRPFIKALTLLEENNLELYNRLNVLFFGNIDNIDIERKLRNVSIINVNGRIPYKEALSYIVNSDVLLMFGNKNSKQIPAKIYDYFGSNSYIFVILGDVNDPVKSVVKDKEKCAVTNNIENEIYENLVELTSRLNEGVKSEPIKEYEWKNISEKLFNIIKG